MLESNACVPRKISGSLPACSAAPHNGVHASQEYSDAARFDHVVVGSRLQQQDTVQFVSTPGDHDDRNPGALPDPAAHLLSFKIRQSEVQQHEIDLSDRLECLFTSTRVLYLVPEALQGLHHHVGKSLIIIHDKDAHGV